MKHKVYASDLNGYAFCPRTIYLSRVLKLGKKPTKERYRGIIEHTLRKELSFRYSRILKRVSEPLELRESIDRELDSTLQGFPFIYRELINQSPEDVDYNALLPELVAGLHEETAALHRKLEFMVKEAGLKKAIEEVTSWRIDYMVESKGLGISGKIDKVLQRNNEYIPVEVKTGRVPFSVWWGDRLQVTAYSMLLEEELDSVDILFSIVEYTAALERRPVKTTERLRRAVLETRDDIIGILEGFVPEVCCHGNKNKCRACSFRTECYSI
ncbi:MAG: CRISPR-associated protein Cas4 [Candidatus Altiarchaeales archaeon ex4484_2]|nr:MAG: CRISPR-associated protein Cas4 [Candidatus Altiarchaeales archaeon ex4484_2]